MLLSFRGILLLTFRELWNRRVILALFVTCTLLWLGLAYLLPDPDSVQMPPGMQEEMGAQQMPRDLRVRFVVEPHAAVISGLTYWGSLLLGLFATVPLFSGFIAPGRIELLGSKPVSRTGLFGGQVAGVLLVVLLLTTYTIGAAWLVIGIKAGHWAPGFLLTIPVVVGTFAALYLIVTLVQLYVDSTALALLTAFGLVFLSIPLRFRDALLESLEGLRRTAFQAAYYVLPHVSENGALVRDLATGSRVEWLPFWLTLVVAVACFALAAYRFGRRDF